jgi:DNA polymerase-3 subunit gamma/tau
MSEVKYLVAARKYRPQRFDEVVAQEHVCDTLKNAITRDRLGHAYLFSGPRGVGKTTVARILAKSINCTTPADERDGAEPCLKCDSCLSFAEGRNLNVIEIDAASNNRVDDVRELRETVRVPPQGGLKKVYIVDEVHMLTSSAFNALLKTLEEPPPYVLFIFATTEPNKVLPTILSRCQRFDFRRISVPEIVDRLKDICEEEGITTDEASLLLIARKGDGALRDALSVFDQAVALCGSDVRYDALADALGVVDVEFYFDLTTSVRERNQAGVLDLVHRIVAAGFDFREFLAGLAEHVRNLFVAMTMPDTSLIEASSAVRDRYAEEARAFSRATLLRLLSIASDTEDALRNSTRPRLHLELGLLKMASISDSLDLKQAIRQLEELQRTLPDQLSALPATAVSDRTPGSVERLSPSPPTEGHGRPEVDTTAAGSQPGRQDDPGAESMAESASTADLDAESEQPVSESSSSSPPDAQPSGPQPIESAETPSEAASEPEVRRDRGTPPDLFGPPALTRKSKGSSNGGRTSGTIEGSAARAAAAAEELVDTSDRIAEWLPFVKAVKSARIHVGSLLQHTAPRRMSGGLIEIDVPDDFHKRLLENQQDFLLKHARKTIHESLRSLRFTVRADVAPPAGETAENFDPYEYMQQKRKDNPVIRAIFDEFGGELVW